MDYRPNLFPKALLAVAVAVALLLEAVILGSLSHTASRSDVIDAQVWFETCGEAAGLKGPELKACIDAEKPVPTTEDPAATSTTAPPPPPTTAPPATAPATLPPTITPPAPATTKPDHPD